MTIAQPSTRARDDETDNRSADPDALTLAREAADRRAAASARPVQRGTTPDPDRRKQRDLWPPVAALFDPNAPTQLALFGDSVSAEVDQ